MKRLLPLLFLVFVLTLPSCKSEFEFVEGSLRPGTAEATLSGGNVTMNFPASAGSASVELNASGDWTATFVNDRAKDWCSVSKESGGRGVAGISVSVRENTDYEQRSATINFTCGDLRRTIVVTQKQKEAILVTSNRVDVGKDGGRISIEVKANVSFDYAVSESAKDWIRAVRAKSLTTTTLLFDVTANDAVEKREGEIVVSGTAGREVVKVYQEGDTPTLVVSRNNYDLTCDAQEIRVEVQHNIDVALEIPSGCDWLRETSTKSMSTSTFSLTVDENEAFSERSCELRFKASALNMEEKVVVRQAAAVPQLFIGEGVYEFGVEGGDLSIDVTSNFGISVEVPDTCSWIKNVTTKGMTTETFNFTIEENDTYADRSGVILFHNESLGITESVTVLQEGDAPQLIIGSRLYEIDAEGGSLSIEVKSNLGLTVTVPDSCSWIKSMTTKTLSVLSFDFVVEENEAFAGREGIIVFANEAQGIMETVTVRQAAAEPQIIIGDGVYEFGVEGGDLSIDVQSNFGISVEVPDSCSWIKNVTTKGMTTKTFSFTIEENDTYAERSGVILFHNESLGITEKVIILQEGEVPQLIIGNTLYEIEAEGGSLSIEVVSNLGLTVTVPDSCSWIRSMTTKTLSVRGFDFVIEENEAFAGREGVIIFANEAQGITETVTVRQAAAEPQIIIGEGVYEFGMEGGDLSIDVQSNFGISVEVPDTCSWIKNVTTRGMTTKTFNFTIEENDTFSDRSGVILFHNESLGITEKVVIHQRQQDAIVISDKYFEVPGEGGQVEVRIDHNIDYQLYFENSWIRQVDTKGLTTDVLLFDIKANDDLYAREGRVRIQSARQTDTLIFHQDHQAYYIRVLSPESRELNPDGGQLVLELEHNPYGFRSTQLLTLNPAQFGERYVFNLPQTRSDSPTRTTATISYSANALRETRYASLVLYNFDQSQVDTLEFHQQPVTILTSDTLVFLPSAASDFSFRVAGTNTGQYSIESYPSWLRIDHVETKDGELVYHWKADANPNAAMRMERIKIYPTKGGWPDVFRVCQEGLGLSFSVMYSSRRVVAPALYGPYREYSTIWWGDGSHQAYTDGATHTYSGSGKHTITVETNRMKFIDWAEVSSFEDGMHIDFSNIAGRKN
ncbi:MAG: BACON domain-containing protein [Bacteroidales bacterium]